MVGTLADPYVIQDLLDYIRVSSIGDNAHDAIEKELSGVKYHRDILYPPDKIVR